MHIPFARLSLGILLSATGIPARAVSTYYISWGCMASYNDGLQDHYYPGWSSSSSWWDPPREDRARDAAMAACNAASGGRSCHIIACKMFTFVDG